MKKFLLSITLMLAAIVGVQAQRVSLDFTTNDSWGFPVGSSNKAVETATFTSGDYSIELTGSSGNGYYFNNDGYLMLGKSGATLTLPAFDFNVSKIEVVGRTGASTSTLENVYVGSTAVSTQCKGSAATNTFEIAAEHQAAGTVYTIKIESKHNAQFTQINIYSADEPATPSVSTPVASVAAGIYTTAQSVTFESEYANAENPSISYYYTTDGSEPTKESTLIEGAVEVTESCTVKVVAVMTVGEEEYTSKVASYEYIISEAAKFVAVTAAEQVVAGKILLVADGKAAHGISGNYGYLPVHNVTAVEGAIEDAVYYGTFELEVAEGGWYIKDNNGKYIYMTGTYNSFNVSEEVPAEGGVWTIAIAEDGTATITNVAMSKYVQYVTKYNSYGAYTEAQDSGILPTLYIPYVEPAAPFEIVAVTPAEAVAELSTITVEFSEEIAGTQDLMAMEQIYVGSSRNMANFTIDGKVLTITLWTPITAAGEYALYVPAGVGITRASNGEAVVIDGEITFTVEEPAAPVTFAVTANIYPVVEGDITEIKNIRVQHNEGPALSDFPTEWTLTNEAGDTFPMSFDWGLNNWDDILITVNPSITAAGTYTLTIPAGSLTTDDGKVCEAATFSWTVVGPVDPYMPRNNGTRTNTGRVIKGITLTGTSGENSYALSDNEHTQDYTDATAVAVFKVEAGEELTITFDKTGEWIHQYVFIDFDGDGFTGSIAEGSDWAPAEDLVAYSFYNNDDASDEFGWNSIGTYLSGNNRSTPAVPAFNAPAEVGTYRMRVKQDWCSIDPAGDADGKFGDFKANGGQIIDVILEVVEATGIEDVEAETVNAIYDLTGRKIEKITEGGIYIVNGKKILVK